MNKINKIKGSFINVNELDDSFYYKNEDGLEQLTDEEIEKIKYVLLEEHDCLTFSCANSTVYEVAVTNALKDGYKLESSSCNSKEWKAILVK